MAQLIVRQLEEELVKKLRVQAALNGRSAEAEHREILRQALEIAGRRTSLKEALAAMPAVGRDEDFERDPDPGRDIDL